MMSGQGNFYNWTASARPVGLQVSSNEGPFNVAVFEVDGTELNRSSWGKFATRGNVVLTFYCYVK
jgi:hypothetical protein